MFLIRKKQETILLKTLKYAEESICNVEEHFFIPWETTVCLFFFFFSFFFSFLFPQPGLVFVF